MRRPIAFSEEHRTVRKYTGWTLAGYGLLALLLVGGSAARNDLAAAEGAEQAAGMQIAAPEAQSSQEIAARPQPGIVGTVTTAGAPTEHPGVDIKALLADPAVRAYSGLAENGWDFNKPETIPGFGSLDPAAPAGEPRTAQTR